MPTIHNKKHLSMSTMSTTPDKGNARTEAALKRLRTAMAEIEADIATHQGIYPFNYGRVTQSELCRRADVKKATLQNPLHKDSTRVEIMAWLDTLNANLMQTRDSTRERVTAVADDLAAELERLTQANQALQQKLEAAELLVAQLRQEIAQLKG
jgi:cob(I)alamin adenosyltransferase